MNIYFVSCVRIAGFVHLIASDLKDDLKQYTTLCFLKFDTVPHVDGTQIFEPGENKDYKTKIFSSEINALVILMKKRNRLSEFDHIKLLLHYNFVAILIIMIGS